VIPALKFWLGPEADTVRFSVGDDDLQYFNVGEERTDQFRVMRL
jgi:hypothetical protein